MLVVSNSTALITLGIVTFLTWLPNLYSKVVIPLEVYNEIAVKGHGMPGSVELQRAVDQRRIEVHSVVDLIGCRELEVNYGLDRGEAEVIALAIELPADLAIIDEEKAWEVAKEFKDKFTTICLPFVLDRAEELGYVRSAINALRDVRQVGKYSPAALPWECWCKARGFP